MKKIITIISLLLLLMIGITYGQTAYITNFESANVSVIDVATNIVIATIPVGVGPVGVSVSNDGSKVYIAISNFCNIGSISVINTATNTVTASIPVGICPQGICVTPDGTKVYVSNDSSNNVSVINTATNSVTATIPVGNKPGGICVTPDGTKVYVSNWHDATVSVINTVSATIPVYSSPGAMIVSPDGNKVYVSNPYNINVINTTTNMVSTIAGSFEDATFSPDGSKVYFSCNDTAVRVMNTANDSILARIIVGNYPFGISITPDGSEVYVANQNDYTVSVINTSTNTVLTQILVGNSPFAFGNFISSATVGIPLQTNSFNTFSIYPNPATNTLTIQQSNPSLNQQLLITDIMGNAIKLITNNSSLITQIDISEWSNGVYFYQLTGEKETVQGKFVKE